LSIYRVVEIIISIVFITIFLTGDMAKSLLHGLR
jgi:hypothetical protein